MPNITNIHSKCQSGIQLLHLKVCFIFDLILLYYFNMETFTQENVSERTPCPQEADNQETVMLQTVYEGYVEGPTVIQVSSRLFNQAQVLRVG